MQVVRESTADRVGEPGTVAPAGGTVGPRIPFELIDEAIHLLDTETAPWSIQLEVRVAGHLDDSRLRRALDQAVAAHPMARARKVAAWPGLPRHQWEIPETTDLDPLRVVDCADDHAVAATRAELQSRPVPLAESPPLRVRLARHPDGDFLMLNVNHAAMDGFGALRVLRSLARAYSGDPDAGEAAAFAEARQLPARMVGGDLQTRLGRYRTIAEKLRDLIVPPARLAPDGGSGEAGYGFHHVSLSPDETRALVALDHPGTVNDLLVAALHRAIGAWNEGHGVRRGRVGVLVPANLRPPEWRQDVVGNFSLPGRVSSTRRDRRTPQDTLRVVTAQTRRMKRTGMGTALIEVLSRAQRYPLWLKEAMVTMMPLTGNRLVDTAMLSNLGPLTDLPSFGPDAGEVTEVWFSPPARMPLGLSIGAVTVVDRLHLVFRYRHRLFDDRSARSFAGSYLAELGSFVPRT
ncbi:MAG TPA: condensation domain-containing protein [Acidimicrobiales bacterium]|nr:condensation domain-containing protein [Acidimicrobiales bacterium]